MTRLLGIKLVLQKLQLRPGQKKNVKFEVTHRYLFESVPKTKSVQFLEKMSWFGDSNSSPSIDRIVPELDMSKEMLLGLKKQTL